MSLPSRHWGILALVLAASPALGQGTISINNVQFVRNASCWDTSPSANLAGVSTPLTQDHLFEVGWWFRVAGDPQETVFPVPDTQSYVSDSSFHSWNDVGGRGLFSAEEGGQVFDYSQGSPNGLLSLAMTVHNLSATTPLALEIFNMADFDVQPTANDDSAALVEWTPNRILQIRDPGGNFAQYIALGSPAHQTHFMVRPFGATDIGAVLSDAAVTDFDNSGVPFGPGDFTAGWQFSMVLAPGQSVTASVYLAVNVTSNCYYLNGLFCDGVELGNTSLWTATAP